MEIIDNKAINKYVRNLEGSYEALLMNYWLLIDSEKGGGVTVCSCAPTSEPTRLQQTTLNPQSPVNNGQTRWITEQNEQRRKWERDLWENGD